MRGVHIILLVMLGFLAGCRSAGNYAPSKYRRNIVLDRQDGKNFLLIDDEQIAFQNLRVELNRRSITDKTAILFLVHENIPPEVFDAVRRKLAEEGFKDHVKIDVFKADSKP